MDVPATAHGLAAGTRFGRFAVVRPVAGGGMSEVYLGVETGAARPQPVAIKRLLPHMAWDPEYVRMFLDEVRIAAELDHPNIVEALDFGLGDGGYYFAMEYLHGETLYSILRAAARDKGIPREVAVSIVLEVAAGLEYAHGTGLVHRDVSPSNVVVTYDGDVKLVDFGIARLRAETRHTRAGTLKGKIGYMSPEQCRGENVDERSDVFGLGILLYELTVGRRAFYDDSEYGVINRTLNGTYRAPGELIPGYPPGLSRVIQRALAMDRESRYPSAASMAGDLRALGHEASRQAMHSFMASLYGEVPPPELDLPMPPRSYKTLLLVAACGGALALGAGGYAAGGGFREATETPGEVTGAAESPSETEGAPGDPTQDAALLEAVADPPLDEPQPASQADAASAVEPLPKPAAGTKSRRSRSKRKSSKASALPETTPPKRRPGEAILPPSWKH